MCDLNQRISRKLESLVTFAAMTFESYYPERLPAVFSELIKDGMSELYRDGKISQKTNKALARGWKNGDYVATSDLLELTQSFIEPFKTSILECGSGLSTIILGMHCAVTNNHIVALEENDRWYNRLNSVLTSSSELRMCSAVKRAQLKSFDSFSWYDVKLEELPRQIDLVVCDGPHGSTPGGRYGLMRCIYHRLAPGARIILDDAERDAERTVIDKWCGEFNLKLENIYTNKKNSIALLRLN